MLTCSLALIRRLTQQSHTHTQATRAKRQQLEATLHELEASIDSAIAATGATSLGAFVRLSSRRYTRESAVWRAYATHGVDCCPAP